MSGPLNLIFLCLTAALAGAVNSVAGGGTLLTFPALYAALAPVGKAAGALANATSSVALMPGSLAATIGYRHDVRRGGRWLAWLLAPSFCGGLIGSLLVVKFPDQFVALVPWLILTAALLFALQPRISSWTRRGLAHFAMPCEQNVPVPLSVDGSRIGPNSLPADAPHPGWRRLAGILAFQFGVSIYGGYFGAGIGILMLASLGLLGLSDIHLMNGVKNACATCINIMAAIVFIIGQKVEWRLALPMLGSAVIGGYVGARLARRTNPALIRRLIVLIGFSLAAYYFYRLLFVPPSAK